MKCRTGLVLLAAAVSLCLLCTSCSRPLPGTVEDSLIVNGLRRTYLVHPPSALSGKAKLPLLIAMHPFTGTGQTMEKLTGFSALADSEDFIVAYPDGHQWVWNANPADPSSLLGPPADGRVL